MKRGTRDDCGQRLQLESSAGADTYARLGAALGRHLGNLHCTVLFAEEHFPQKFVKLFPRSCKFMKLLYGVASSLFRLERT